MQGSATRDEYSNGGIKRTSSGKEKQSKNVGSNGIITGRVSKSKSKSITPKANRKKAATEELVKEIKKEGMSSGDDVMLMEKDSNDEAFSLSEFDGDINFYDAPDAMDEF